MNILLIYICYPPESYDPFGSRLPIGLGYLATALINEGHAVTIENLSTGGLKDLEKILKSADSNQSFDVAGFSLFTFNRKAVIEATKLVKKISPDTITVVGGPHPTALPQDFPSKYPSIDVSVSGPGEGPIVQIMEDIQYNDLQQESSPETGTDITLPLPETKGSHEQEIREIQKSETLKTGEYDPKGANKFKGIRPSILKEIVEPIAPVLQKNYKDKIISSHQKVRDGLSSDTELKSDCLDYLGSPSMGMHKSGVTNPDDYTYLNSSRGCLGNCTFCSSPSFWNRKNTFHSVDWILKELHFRIKEIGCNFISFRDESFTSDNSRIRSLCEAIISDDSLSFLWDCQCRADQIDEKTTDLMAYAGCRTIQIGVEHGSEDIRKLLGKPCTDETIIKSTTIIRNSGMEASWYLISAIPDETKADRLKTRQLVKKANPTDVLVSPLSIYPGTALFNMFSKKKKLNDDFWFNSKNDWVLALPQEEALAIAEKENIAIGHMTKNSGLSSKEIMSALLRITKINGPSGKLWPLIWAFNLALANEGQIEKAKTNLREWKKEHLNQSNYWLDELENELLNSDGMVNDD